MGVGAPEAAFAQTPAPSVEIASVKPNPAGMGALGLKLETRRVPLDVIVIERAERPMPD